MGDQGNLKGYFGAPVKQLKRKAVHSVESTAVNEKKTKSGNPTDRVRKFQEFWKDTFLWVINDANQDVMYCSISYMYVESIPPSVANLQSSLNIGSEPGGKFRIDSLVHHNASNQF